MITFKQFLSEEIFGNVMVEWDVQWPHDAQTIIDRFCPNNFVDSIKSGPLYRGFAKPIFSADTNPFCVIDTTDSKRMSRGSSNAYQILMSMSNSLSAVPDRHKSIICTQNEKLASTYGAREIADVIIPYDGTVMAFMNNVSDVLYQSVIRIADYDIDFAKINRAFAIINGALYPSASHYIHDVEQVKQLDVKLKTVPIEWVFLTFLASIEHPSLSKMSMLFEKPNTSLTNLLMHLNRNAEYISPEASSRYTTFVERLDDYQVRKSLNSKGLQLFNWFEKIKQIGLFQGLADELLTPDNLQLKTTTSISALNDMSEVWFVGKCLVMNKNMYLSLVEKLKENGKTDNDVI